MAMAVAGIYSRKVQLHSTPEMRAKIEFCSEVTLINLFLFFMIVIHLHFLLQIFRTQTSPSPDPSHKDPKTDRNIEIENLPDRSVEHDLKSHHTKTRIDWLRAAHFYRRRRSSRQFRERTLPCPPPSIDRDANQNRSPKGGRESGGSPSPPGRRQKLEKIKKLKPSVEARQGPGCLYILLSDGRRAISVLFTHRVCVWWRRLLLLLLPYNLVLGLSACLDLRWRRSGRYFGPLWAARP